MWRQFNEVLRWAATHKVALTLAGGCVVSIASGITYVAARISEHIKSGHEIEAIADRSSMFAGLIAGQDCNVLGEIESYLDHAKTVFKLNALRSAKDEIHFYAIDVAVFDKESDLVLRDMSGDAVVHARANIAALRTAADASVNAIDKALSAFPESEEVGRSDRTDEMNAASKLTILAFGDATCARNKLGDSCSKKIEAKCPAGPYDDLIARAIKQHNDQTN